MHNSIRVRNKGYKMTYVVVVTLLILCGSLFGCTMKVEAGSKMSLTELQNKFPSGKYWNHAGSSVNNPDGYTSTPCTHHGNDAVGCRNRNHHRKR